jgi:hypothetical protein
MCSFGMRVKRENCKGEAREFAESPGLCP